MGNTSLVANPLDRYLIDSSMLGDMKFGAETPEAELLERTPTPGPTPA